LDGPTAGRAATLRDALFGAFADFRRMPLLLSEALHMPPGEFMTLHRIGGYGPPWECSVSDLSAKTRVSMSAMSQSLASLERKGYVKRSISERDRRRITVTLTPAGQACARKLNEQLELIMARTVEGYGEAEMWALIGQTRRLIDVMERAHREVARAIRHENRHENRSEGENRP